ncbi:Uncharacterised protein [Mycobacterium tuberculosis]|uniref:Uncharacterized protein n=1 Tax=Mycobacterium tuberculosis TaxID=1773 RepID=A0A916LGF3_MYCTX|nr:Uncharacterised protein [Mycobacterium tuberculosis]CPA69122.1 Uncharacterised protein [Mycobacterium tuberculosis]
MSVIPAGPSTRSSMIWYSGASSMRETMTPKTSMAWL